MTLLKVTLQSAAEDCLILLDDYCLLTLCNSSKQKNYSHYRTPVKSICNSVLLQLP